jgi:hypothetical protein
LEEAATEASMAVRLGKEMSVVLQMGRSSLRPRRRIEAVTEREERGGVRMGD